MNDYLFLDELWQSILSAFATSLHRDHPIVREFAKFT